MKIADLKNLACSLGTALTKGDANNFRVTQGKSEVTLHYRPLAAQPSRDSVFAEVNRSGLFVFKQMRARYMITEDDVRIDIGEKDHDHFFAIKFSMATT